MNIIYAVIMILSIGVMIFTSPDKMLSSMLNGANEAIVLSISMVAIYAVWLTLIAIMEKTGINKKIDKLLRPITRRLFKGESDEAHEAAAINMSANLLGMGGAATPMGIKTIESMKKRKDGKASDNMILFVVINCTSLQLLPTTVIGMRAAAGSAEAGAIIIPSLIASIISTAVGVVLCLLIRRFSKSAKTAEVGKNVDNAKALKK